MNSNRSLSEFNKQTSIRGLPKYQEALFFQPFDISN
nr:MAG TPA: hypothetical protein [Caudoviricetes sp.]